MTIKQQGGVFGRNPTFNNVTVDKALRLEGASYSYVLNSADAGREILLLRGKSSVADGGAINLYGDGDPTAPNQIVFFTSNSAVGRFDANGNLLVGTSTSPSGSGQIVANGGVYLGGTGAANLLDDYEEGTWSPVISDATSGGNTGTSTVTYATYTKVGNLVHLKARLLNMDTTGMGSGNIYVQGVPFAADGDGDGVASMSYFTAAANSLGIVPSIDNGASHIKLKEVISGGVYINADSSQFASGTADLWITITYHT